MTKPIVNPFSKDYVPKIKIDHQDRKYKRPEINRLMLNLTDSIHPGKSEATRTENYRRIARTEI